MDERAQRLDLSAMLRALRRRADLSQRQLADRAGMTQAQVAQMETGSTADPHLRTVERLVGAAGARLAVLDLDGTEPVPLATDDQRDRAGRRFPPHLDLVPRTRWRGIYRWDWTGFVRHRGHRDLFRREAAGERRCGLLIEVRKLGPRDAAVLAALRADAAVLDLAGRPAPVQASSDDGAWMRYLRNPGLRHWVAESPRRVLGHLVAHVQVRYAGPPALVVTDIGVRADERDGAVGPLLAAAVRDEAERLGGDVRALADHPAVAAYLRRLGFLPAPRGYRLLAA